MLGRFDKALGVCRRAADAYRLTGEHRWAVLMRATADVCQDADRCEGDDRPDRWNRLEPAELVAPASALLSSAWSRSRTSCAAYFQTWMAVEIIATGLRFSDLTQRPLAPVALAGRDPAWRTRSERTGALARFGRVGWHSARAPKRPRFGR